MYANFYGKTTVRVGVYFIKRPIESTNNTIGVNLLPSIFFMGYDVRKL